MVIIVIISVITVSSFCHQEAQETKIKCFELRSFGSFCVDDCLFVALGLQGEGPHLGPQVRMFFP